MTYIAELISDIETNNKRLTIEEASTGDYEAVVGLLDRFEEASDYSALDDARIYSDTECTHPFTIDDDDAPQFSECGICSHVFVKQADGEGSWDLVSA